jgi:putative ABC transport system permease protein
LPVPGAPPGEVVIDATDRAALGLDALPADVEIAGHRARVERSASGFAFFLGSPYVFARYRDAARYLQVEPDRTMFLVVKVADAGRGEAVERALRSRFPDLEVWSRPAFSRSARRYWLFQTGAGGALLKAALLGFVVGTVIASQTTYATTMENLEEFATLAAMGASRRFVAAIVLAQGVISAVLGTALGIALESLAAESARSLVAWIYAPAWLRPTMFGIAGIMCSIASLASITKVIGVEPARVFRA